MDSAFFIDEMDAELCQYVEKATQQLGEIADELRSLKQQQVNIISQVMTGLVMVIAFFVAMVALGKFFGWY